MPLLPVPFGPQMAKFFPPIFFPVSHTANTFAIPSSHMSFISSEIPMLARIISEIAHAETGIDIHPGADTLEPNYHPTPSSRITS